MRKELPDLKKQTGISREMWKCKGKSVCVCLGGKERYCGGQGKWAGKETRGQMVNTSESILRHYDSPYSTGILRAKAFHLGGQPWEERQLGRAARHAGVGTEPQKQLQKWWVDNLQVIRSVCFASESWKPSSVLALSRAKQPYQVLLAGLRLKQKWRGQEGKERKESSWKEERVRWELGLCGDNK